MPEYRKALGELDPADKFEIAYEKAHEWDTLYPDYSPAPEAGYEVASWEMNGDTAGVRNLDFAVKSKVDVLKNDIPFKNVNENKTLGFLKNRAFLFA